MCSFSHRPHTMRHVWGLFWGLAWAVLRSLWDETFDRGEESSPWERFHCPICIVMPPWRRGQRDTFLILLLTTDDISLAPGLSSYFGWYVRKKGTDNRMRQIGLFRVHLPYIICGLVAQRHRCRYYESFLTTAQLDNNSTWRHRQRPEGGVRWDGWACTIGPDLRSWYDLVLSNI